MTESGVFTVNCFAILGKFLFLLLFVALKMDLLILFYVCVCLHACLCPTCTLDAHSSQDPNPFGSPGAAVTSVSVCHHVARAANALSHRATSPAPCNVLLKEKSLETSHDLVLVHHLMKQLN